MQRALHELPLALFTTISSISAGTFICLALAALLLGALPTALQKRLDKLTVVAVVLVMLGFVSSVFHLTNPFHGIYVFSHLGTSPLSNELFVAGIFTACMMVFVVLALLSKLNHKARIVLASITALVALVFAAFIGKAYMMPTITTWNTNAMVVALVGYCLMGGILLGTALMGFAGVFSDKELVASSKLKRFGFVALVLLVLGLVLSLYGTWSQYSLAAYTVTPFVNGADYTAEVSSFFISFVVLSIVAALVGVFALLSQKKPALFATLAVILFYLAVFCARIVFYATEISVGV